MLGMSWLPALGFALAAVAAVRLVRRGSSPLGRGWPADLALIVVAAGLGLRAYNAFTTYGSYAPYFAAPLVLLLGILHTRVAERRPQARLAALGALGPGRGRPGRVCAGRASTPTTPPRCTPRAARS